MEELQARHRKEQKDLQSRITQKKKNATKKTRKGINDECDALQQELTDRQQSEVAALNGKPLDSEFEQLEVNDPAPVIGDANEATRLKEISFDQASIKSEEIPTEQETRAKKPNRQKARLARRAAEQEAQAAAAAEEAANLPDLREQELTSMKTQMQKLGLTETFVRPDGHCLYSACALNIPDSKSGPYKEGYQNVRFVTADFISKHPDDFAAFLEEPLDSYAKKIRDTAEWGGHLELQAIARSFKTTISVLQADGRVEKFKPEEEADDASNVWLAYYRHSYGLGEHYNALKASTT